MQEEFTKGANHMVELLKSQHGGVVKELESYGVQFNEVDGDAFRAAMAPLYAEQEGMTCRYIQDNLFRTRLFAIT